MTIEDAKNACTVSTIWVCMIDGRFLKGKSGAMAWGRKNDAVTTFKHSEYWSWVVDGLKEANRDLVSEGYRGGLYWNDRRKGQEIEKTAYEKLLADKVVKFYEIEPIPDWVG